MRRFAPAVLLLAALAGPALVAASGGDASAAAAYESPYTFEQTWGTALRLIRVDLGCIVTEKDAENGYLLFEYTSPESGNRVHRGSLEIVRGKLGAHVAVQLPSLPMYHEQMIVDALAKKLTSEHGNPPPRPVPPPPAPPPDGGADGG
jgi:hypothetical protein